MLDEIIVKKIIYTDESITTGDFLRGVPLPFKPKQIMEVVPQNIDKDIKGKIILQLKINNSGKVSDFRIVFNSTKSKECLDYTVQAAKKSIWEAAIINNHPVEYWIEKTYKFNM